MAGSRERKAKTHDYGREPSKPNVLFVNSEEKLNNNEPVEEADLISEKS